MSNLNNTKSKFIPEQLELFYGGPIEIARHTSKEEVIRALEDKKQYIFNGPNLIDKNKEDLEYKCKIINNQTVEIDFNYKGELYSFSYDIKSNTPKVINTNIKNIALSKIIFFIVNNTENILYELGLKKIKTNTREPQQKNLSLKSDLENYFPNTNFKTITWTDMLVDWIDKRKKGWRFLLKLPIKLPTKLPIKEEIYVDIEFSNWEVNTFKNITDTDWEDTILFSANYKIKRVFDSNGRISNTSFLLTDKIKRELNMYFTNLPE